VTFRAGLSATRAAEGRAERVTAYGFDARWRSLELLRNSQAPQAEPSNEFSFEDQFFFGEQKDEFASAGRLRKSHHRAAATEQPPSSSHHRAATRLTSPS
jgi:hypothetical protein